MKRERKLYYIGVVVGVAATMAVQVIPVAWGYAWYTHVVCGVLYDIGYRVAVKIAGTV